MMPVRIYTSKLIGERSKRGNSIFLKIENTSPFYRNKMEGSKPGTGGRPGSERQDKPGGTCRAPFKHLSKGG